MDKYSGQIYRNCLLVVNFWQIRLRRYNLCFFCDFSRKTLGVNRSRDVRFRVMLLLKPLMYRLNPKSSDIDVIVFKVFFELSFRIKSKYSGFF